MSKKSEKIRLFLLSLFCIPFFMSPAVFALDIKYIGGSGSTNIDCLDSNYNLDVTCGSGNTTASGKIEKRGPSGICYGAGGNTDVPGSCFTGKYTCCGATAQERIERCNYEPTTDQYECLGSPGTVSCGQLNATLGYDCSDPVLLDATGSPSGTGPMPGCCAVGEDGNQTHLQCTPFEDVYRCDEIPGCARSGAVVSIMPTGNIPEDGGCCSDTDFAFEYPAGEETFTCRDCWPNGFPKQVYYDGGSAGNNANIPDASDTGAHPGPSSAADCCSGIYYTMGGNGFCGNSSQITLVEARLPVNGNQVSGWNTTLTALPAVAQGTTPTIELEFSDTVGGTPPSVATYAISGPDAAKFALSPPNGCIGAMQDGNNTASCVQNITFTADTTNSANGDAFFEAQFDLEYDGNTEFIAFNIEVGASTLVDCYPDGDGDTYGDASATVDQRVSCLSTQVEDNTDCCDSDDTVHPSAPWSVTPSNCGGWDKDCDGSVETEYDYSAGNFELGRGTNHWGSCTEVVLGTNTNSVENDSSFCGVSGPYCGGGPSFDNVYTGSTVQVFDGDECDTELSRQNSCIWRSPPGPVTQPLRCR